MPGKSSVLVNFDDSANDDRVSLALFTAICRYDFYVRVLSHHLMNIICMRGSGINGRKEAMGKSPRGRSTACP